MSSGRGTPRRAARTYRNIKIRHVLSTEPFLGTWERDVTARGGTPIGRASLFATIFDKPSAIRSLVQTPYWDDKSRSRGHVAHSSLPPPFILPVNRRVTCEATARAGSARVARSR